MLMYKVMKVSKHTYDLLSNPDATLAELNPAYDDLVKSAIEQGRNPDANGFIQKFAAHILELMEAEKSPAEILAELDARIEAARGVKGPVELAHIKATTDDFRRTHPHEEPFSPGVEYHVDNGRIITGQEAKAKQAA